ncbi:hypothetical protein E2C01_098324 [Portunus trituberculatus]|uniref:Uncharacterized protein n=1 Tax=Portunus trituberculatus TaxID=210409 RepID=A0A5B7K7D8_PORTR|nr:hypothetical protein [Portunus trituberculatus]
MNITSDLALALNPITIRPGIVTTTITATLHTRDNKYTLQVCVCVCVCLGCFICILQCSSGTHSDLSPYLIFIQFFLKFLHTFCCYNLLTQAVPDVHRPV